VSKPITLRPVPPVAEVLNTLANHLDLEPNRPADPIRIRVRARMLGLHADLTGLLPTPGDTHQSAYAIRLRKIAGAGA
jgi:hypothetical protein